MTSELKQTHTTERAHWYETHVTQLPARAARLVPISSLPSGEVADRGWNGESHLKNVRRSRENADATSRI